ncbi:MAG TPA: hypothetical protein VFF28_02910, partial [Candidatus Nanoarchaeia archaeon]|nr:hypothetical protein [Candidatus Nanoarchaeia archaeon]
HGPTARLWALWRQQLAYPKFAEGVRSICSTYPIPVNAHGLPFIISPLTHRGDSTGNGRALHEIIEPDIVHLDRLPHPKYKGIIADGEFLTVSNTPASIPHCIAWAMPSSEYDVRLLEGHYPRQSVWDSADEMLRLADMHPGVTIISHGVLSGSSKSNRHQQMYIDTFIPCQRLLYKLAFGEKRCGLDSKILVKRKHSLLLDVIGYLPCQMLIAKDQSAVKGFLEKYHPTLANLDKDFLSKSTAPDHVKPYGLWVPGLDCFEYDPRVGVTVRFLDGTYIVECFPKLTNRPSPNTTLIGIGPATRESQGQVIALNRNDAMLLATQPELLWRILYETSTAYIPAMNKELAYQLRKGF